MPIKPSLRILLDSAQKQSDTALKKLGQLASQQQQADQKLKLLLEYQHNYQSRLEHLAKTGINHSEWLNFNVFMNKLAAAITEQRITVTNTQNNSKAGGDKFLSCQRKLKSYRTLLERHHQIETQKQMKHEQKEQDEHASNTPARNKFMPIE